MPASATTRKPATPASASSRYMRRLARLQPHAATAAGTGRALADQFDPSRAERTHQLHQGIDIAAHNTVARLHALDRRHGQTGNLSQPPLVDAEQCTRRPHLPRRNHKLNIISRCQTQYKDVYYL